MTDPSASSPKPRNVEMVRRQSSHEVLSLKKKGEGVRPRKRMSVSLDKRAQVGKVMESHLVDRFIVALVMLYCVVVFVQIIIHDPDFQYEYPAWIDDLLAGADLSILTIFLLEIILKVYAFGRKFFVDWLYVFDAIVVVVSFVMSVVEILSTDVHGHDVRFTRLRGIMRLLRVLILFRKLSQTAVVIREMKTSALGYNIASPVERVIDLLNELKNNEYLTRQQRKDVSDALKIVASNQLYDPVLEDMAAINGGANQEAAAAWISNATQGGVNKMQYSSSPGDSTSKVRRPSVAVVHVSSKKMSSTDVMANRLPVVYQEGEEEEEGEDGASPDRATTPNQPQKYPVVKGDKMRGGSTGNRSPRDSLPTAVARPPQPGDDISAMSGTAPPSARSSRATGAVGGGVVGHNVSSSNVLDPKRRVPQPRDVVKMPAAVEGSLSPSVVDGSEHPASYSGLPSPAILNKFGHSDTDLAALPASSNQTLSRSSSSWGAEQALSIEHSMMVEKTRYLEPEVARHLKSLPNTWDFDIFKLTALTSDNALAVVGTHVVETFAILEECRIPKDVWWRYITKLQGGYHSDNPYHKLEHAADVLHAITWTTVSADLLAITDMDVFEFLGLVVAAAAHDVEHPGYNNQFCVRSSHPLAIRYNDKSVLENHHAATAYAIALDEKLNAAVFDSLSETDFVRVREIVVACILATDMATHFADLGHLKSRVATGDFLATESKGGASPSGAAGGGKSPSKEDKLLIMKVCLHACDVSNPAKGYRSYLRWTDRVLQEFFAQGDAEKAAGYSVSMLMDRATTNIAKVQMGFLDIIIFPLFDAISDVLPRYSQCKRNVENNKRFWADKIELMEQEMQNGTQKMPDPPRDVIQEMHDDEELQKKLQQLPPTDRGVAATGGGSKKASVAVGRRASDIAGATHVRASADLAGEIDGYDGKNRRGSAGSDGGAAVNRNSDGPGQLGNKRHSFGGTDSAQAPEDPEAGGGNEHAQEEKESPEKTENDVKPPPPPEEASPLRVALPGEVPPKIDSTEGPRDNDEE